MQSGRDWKNLILVAPRRDSTWVLEVEGEDRNHYANLITHTNHTMLILVTLSVNTIECFANIQPP